MVLLDEYQDTSAAQAIMLRGLFSGRTAERRARAPGDRGRRPVPGDLRMAGRGGEQHPDLRRRLSAVRRPTGSALRADRQPAQRATILDVANVLSRTAADRDRQRDRQRLCHDRLGGAGMGLLRPAEATPIGQVRAATFETWPEEVSWIGDQIAGLRASGEVSRWADIAVLTRRNADIAPLYAELTARDVPVEIVGLGGLLYLPEIMDVTATLRLIDDVTANPDLIRLLTGPRWRIGPRDLALLGRRARELARAAPEPRDDPADEPGQIVQSSPHWSAPSPRSTRPRWSACSTLWRARARRAVLAAGARAVRSAIGRAGLAAPAQRRAGARPDPAGDRHPRPGRRADGHPRVRPDLPARPARRLPRRGRRLRRRRR